jgi:hypothetical protein
VDPSESCAEVVLMMGIFGGYRCDELCKMMDCYT